MTAPGESDNPFIPAEQMEKGSSGWIDGGLLNDGGDQRTLPPRTNVYRW